MNPKVIQIEDIVREMQLHGWHLSHSGPVSASVLPSHPPGDEFLELIGHMFVATSENGGVMMGVIVVRPNGVVTTHSTYACFDETVDDCAKKIMRRYARAEVECSLTETTTWGSSAHTHTLH